MSDLISDTKPPAFTAVTRADEILRGLESELVQLLQTLVRTNSVAIPPDGAETAAQLVLLQFLQRYNVEAELYATTRSRAQVEHALAVLCGQPPANFSIAAKASNIVPPEVPAGLPSALLQRRPDIVEAEQLLQASSARIGVAKAAFFPTIKLTSTAGLATADLGTLVDWPSRVWSVGPSIHVPIFEGGRNRANLKSTEARYEQSVASYRGTILNAFREVEDALSDLSSLSSQSEAVNRALVSARDTAALANERYQRGLSNYLDVVDAQRTALQAERQETQLRGQRAISTILLAKAMGGGWERDPAQP